MPLRTVRVPPDIEEPFLKAEELVSRFFSDRRDDPERGTIEIFGERYVLVRAASLSVEFFRTVHDLYGPGREAEADDFARNILFDLAHAIGKSDARNFHERMQLTDPIARLSAGPIHFAWSGWAFVDIFPESRPVPNEDYYLCYDHPYSFESDAWRRAGQPRDFPVCIMNSGYSSGWCEESFGVRLVASEILCRARGDEACRFIMAHPDHIERHVGEYIREKPDLAARLRDYQIPDFFARKRMEEELRKARELQERQIEERTGELKTANELLRREIAERADVESKLRQAHKLEAIGRLAGGIAHDFNNLMGVVLTRGGLLARRLALWVPPNDPVWQELQQVTDAAKRAAGLTQQLLTFSRARVLRMQVLDVNRLLAELGATLVPLIGEHIELVIGGEGAPGSGLTILADRGQIEQVIMNLVVNARDAMPEAGTLTMGIERADLPAATSVTTGMLAAGRYAVLTVTDTGSGMDEETLSKIFDPFFTTKREGKGTGLGLSTVYGVVEQLGGGIAVDSAPGRGATFRLYLPMADGPPDATERRGGDPTALAGGSETILLVEDLAELRDAVNDALLACGYRVLVAPDATAALELAAGFADTIHLLVTDLVMPRVGGRELADQLRAVRPGVRVLYMSGYAPDSAFRHGAPEPGTGFLQKPFLPLELARQVREMLDG